jgi:DNA-cytosine methyltransferase
MGINVLSLFDGISCGQIALNRVGIEYDNYFASEIDINAIKVTKHNYPNTTHIGDINDIEFTEYHDIDILIGGSPCQDLSRCNLENKGLIGERSKLFFKYIEALRVVKPMYYLFENVGSMTNNNMKIISQFFGHKPICINSKLVSPQSRERYYWTNIPNVTIPTDNNILVKDIIENVVPKKYYLKMDYTYIPKETNKHNSKSGLQFVCGIISKKKWLNDGKENSRNFSQGNRVYSINGKSCTINANAGGLGGKSGLYYLEDGKEFSKSNIRRLTPLETERLQTIPDNYTDIINETNRYKCIGNGWTVDIIAHIFKFIPDNKSGG